MEVLEYTKLSYFDQVFCPECGKLLKGRQYFACEGGFTEDPEYYPYYTYRCKDCKISATTIDVDLSNIEAWKFPKNFTPTITQKQINYINYLADHFYELVRGRPVITNKELAAAWISQFVKLLEEEKREEINDDAIKAIFKKYGYGYSYDREEDRLTFSSSYSADPRRSQLNEYAYLELIYMKDSKDIIVSSNSNKLSPKSLGAYTKMLVKAEEDIKNIKKEINKLVYPDEQAGKDKVAQEKEAFKQACSNRERYNEYDRYDYDDFLEEEPF